MVLIVKLKKRREHEPASSASPASLDAGQTRAGEDDGDAGDKEAEHPHVFHAASVDGVQRQEPPLLKAEEAFSGTNGQIAAIASPDSTSASSHAHESDATTFEGGTKSPLHATETHDIDALTGAFERTGISGADTSSAGSTSAPTDGVGLFVAPAVLGHRWVRSRSTEYIVERPERLRASMLGIAALLGRRYDAAKRKNGVLMAGTETQIDTLNAFPNNNRLALASLPIHVLLSHERVALDSSHKGLAMVHALEEEYLSASDMGEGPPAYTRTRSLSNTSEWLTAPTAYSAYVHALCRLAPVKEPAPPAPRSSRQAVARSHKEESEEKDMNTDDSTDAPWPSEVPDHLPQGDLYLCGVAEGNRQPHDDDNRFAVLAAAPEAPTTPPRLAVEVKGEHGIDAQEAPHQKAPRQTVEGTTTPRQESEADVLRAGSLGAIEASLGACCAALDHIVHAARRQGDQAKGAEAPRTKLVRRLDMDNLHQASEGLAGQGPPHKDGSEFILPICRRAFVLARPPGHHCSANRPSGFCWVNNVAVMAMHAYAVHGIDRIMVLDFDLHHGDGTQSIAWRINAQTAVADADRTARLKAFKAERESHARSRGAHRSHAARQVNVATKEDDEDDELEAQVGPRGLQIFYGSLHDIESFPCEDGDKGKVSDASVCVAGAHGQWIWNVHLDAHPTGEAYENAYATKYAQLFRQAERFLDETEARPDTSLVIISAGFDANEHEHAGMQRHGKSVPPSFYTRFTRDAVRLAEQRCAGKCISVLEGGYSDRALMTGVAAHVAGLTGSNDDEGAAKLSEPSILTQLDKVSKAAHASLATRSGRRDGDDRSDQHAMPVGRRRAELTLRDPDWLRYTLEALQRMQVTCGKMRVRDAGVGSTPATPTATSGADGMASSDWRRTPRATRATRTTLANVQQASPASEQKARENDAAASLLSLHG